MDHRALMAVFGGPLPRDHIPPAPLAACSPGASYPEKEASSVLLECSFSIP